MVGYGRLRCPHHPLPPAPLPAQIYYDGEVVQGLVCLNVREPVAVEGIECQLSGAETTHWIEMHDQGRPGDSDRYMMSETHGGTLQIFACGAQLPGGSRRFEPGQYQVRTLRPGPVAGGSAGAAWQAHA